MNLNNHGKTAIVLIAIVLTGIAAWRFGRQGDSPAKAAVRMPELSPLVFAGQKAFDENCARCHGSIGDGTDRGPPFVHDIYNPGHHDDASFYRAAERGVRRHHWTFGDMPPQPQVSKPDLEAIISYVRALQKVNGIEYERHRR